MNSQSRLAVFLRLVIRRWATRKGGARPGPLMFLSGVFMVAIWAVVPQFINRLMEFPAIGAAIKNNVSNYQLWADATGWGVAIFLSYWGMKPFWRATMLCFPESFGVWEGNPEDDDLTID